MQSHSHTAPEVDILLTCQREIFCQVGESSVFLSKCYAIVFVRFVSDNEIQEMFFFCKELPGKAKV